MQAATTLDNPLREGVRLERTAEPCAVVIFGASGDLTKRKLFPALYSLAYRRLLPENFAIVGVSRSEESDDEFRERMKEAVTEYGRDEFREDAWELLALGARHVRRNTLLVEQRNIDGTLVGGQKLRASIR